MVIVGMKFFPVLIRFKTNTPYGSTGMMRKVKYSKLTHEKSIYYIEHRRGALEIQCNFKREFQSLVCKTKFPHNCCVGDAEFIIDMI